MKMTVQTGSYVRVLVVAIVAIAYSCGRQDNSASSSGEDLGADSSVSQQVLQSNVQESLESLSEENSSASLNLDANPELELASGVSRSCVVESQSAKVTISSDISKDVTISGRLRTIKRSLSGKGEQVRVWSRSGGSVDCAASGKYAGIDWKNVDGLSLKVSFSRSRAASDSITNIKKGTTVSRSSAYDASGTRAIAWSQGSADTSSSVVRNKVVTSSVVRSFSATKTSGEKIDLKLTTEILAANPFKVTVTRASSDLSLQSKLINSGTMIATSKDGARVESSFVALLINYKDGSCTPESGSIVSKFFAKDATVASKTLQTSFENGVGTVTDENGQDSGSIEQNGCDPEDLGA